MPSLTGPGCPACNYNIENHIEAFMYDEHDDTKIVGYQVVCFQCGQQWDEWLYREYGIVRDDWGLQW